MSIHRNRALFAASIAIVALSVAGRAQKRWEYPPTRTVDQVDAYHGVRVADPYRWLEDDNAPETKAWVDAQNAVTFGYLNRLPFRVALRARLEALYNYPKSRCPLGRAACSSSPRTPGSRTSRCSTSRRGFKARPPCCWIRTRCRRTAPARLTVFEPSKDAYTRRVRSITQRV